MNIVVATSADIPRFRTFLNAALTSLGLPTTASTTVLRGWLAQGYWYFVFVEEAGVIYSGLLAHPVETARWGRVCKINMLMVRPSLTNANKLLALDTLIFWMCNRLQSVGIQIAFGVQRRNISDYVANGLGATEDPERSNADEVFLWGRLDEIALRVMARHPTWQL